MADIRKDIELVQIASQEDLFSYFCQVLDHVTGLIKANEVSMRRLQFEIALRSPKSL